MVATPSIVSVAPSLGRTPPLVTVGLIGLIRPGAGGRPPAANYPHSRRAQAAGREIEGILKHAHILVVWEIFFVYIGDADL